MNSSKRTARLGWSLAILLILLGFGLRLYDLKDPPLDFHGTRQLRSAIITRSIYYDRLPNADPAVRALAARLTSLAGQYEPPILENLVALAYLAVGSETLWLSRIFTSLFWCIGGLALYDLTRRMTSSWAALVSLAFYLFLPFAVQASRSFQPDPGMTMWIVLFAWAVYRWSEKQSWKWVIFAGVFGGMAVLTKAVAAYIVGGAALAVVLYTLGFKRAIRNAQPWVIAVLMVIPSALYYLVRRPERASGYFQSWTLDLIHLLADPTVYFRWFNLLVNLMGLFAILLAIAGIALASQRSRSLLLGLWIGYLVYGLTLPYQMYTHNYYHLQLVPIISISLSASVQAILDKLVKQKKIWQIMALASLMIAIGYASVTTMLAFKSENHRDAPAYWQEIGSKLPTDGKILALTQDYGFPLGYYGWRKVALWPTRGERQVAAMRGNEKKFEQYFANKGEGASYFLVTAFNQFNDQQDLKDFLYSHYPVAAEGNGYLIFNLETPLEGTP